MEIMLLAIAMTLTFAIIVMIGFGFEFKIRIIHEHIVPQPPVLQQLVETDRDRENREKDNIQKDIVSAINNYLYDREVDK